MVPDAYHAAHATVYFNGSVEPQSLKLASTDFLVVSSDESLLDEFPPGETSFAKEINYSMVRVEIGQKANIFATLRRELLTRGLDLCLGRSCW
jgi:hypothetical protein